MKNRIAIQGVKGAFHEEAARKVFGNDIEIVPCSNFKTLTEKLVNSEVDNAMMAIENTISGTILKNYELIRTNDLFIIGETYLRIGQNLGGIKGSKIEELKVVSSHYMALNQCREFFEDYQEIQLLESSDTALSLREVAEGRNTSNAAVGSKLAIDYYGLEVLAANIETNKLNYTRFAVLSKEKQRNNDSKKVSVSMVLKHETGTLSRILSLLDLLHVNLTKIESSPVIGKPFEYRFYLDFITGDKVSYQTIIEALTPLTQELNILGRYTPEQTSELWKR